MSGRMAWGHCAAQDTVRQPRETQSSKPLPPALLLHLPIETPSLSGPGSSHPCKRWRRSAYLSLPLKHRLLPPSTLSHLCRLPLEMHGLVVVVIPVWVVTWTVRGHLCSRS